MKKVLGAYGNPNRSIGWATAFPVRSLFSYDSLGEQVSPFLLLDYAGPADFEPAAASRAASASIRIAASRP